MIARAFWFSILLWTAHAQAEGFTSGQIQKFIDDAIAAGGGEVVLPPGRHRLSEPLIIKDAEKLRLVGLEAEATWLLPAAEVEKPFPLVVIAGSAKDVRLVKITLTTQEAGAAFAGEPLVRVEGEGDQRPEVLLDRCLFERHAGSGVLLQGVGESRIADCVFMDLGGTALEVSGASRGVVIEHNHLTRCAEPALVLRAETSQCQIIANESPGLEWQIEGEGHQSRDNDPSP